MMAFAKQNVFSQQQIALSEFAKALAHPARIAVISHLQESGPCPCGSIVDALPLAQATVSQHLRALREAGLVNAETDGPKVLYSLNCDTIRTFCHSFQCTLGTIAEDNETLTQ